nr:uncharacterized protein LOC114919047 [Labrus bergylta]
MWCYQKPGFEALLLAELQRQQQCNQFCDTLIKTEGVSVPAHSCILSAISPQISSSLSALPAPPTGQSRHLDFRALGTCTLLHLVRLLYSGQMAGEGEEERQEAVSAAARLGIHGLVEVTRGRNEEGEGQHREEGVQTEPLIPGEGEERRGRWRREERNEGTFLWRETVSDGKKDTWTQTEELQVTTATPSHPAASFETIDMGALQTLQQTEPHLLPPYVSYLPVSLVYEPDETQGRNTPSTDRCWAGAAAGDLEDNQLEQFHDNIPGYINYFLNPHQEAGPCRGRKSGRRAAGTGGTRRAATGERGTRRPQAKTGGRRRGRGVLTQTVDVQSVGVSKLQKMFLQRWGMKTPRTGQGGGAVGRRLYLKTREQLKPAKSCQRKRRRGKEWDFSQSGDLREGGESNIQLYNQDGLPVGRPKRTKAKQTSAPVSSPPLKFDNVYHALSNSSPVLHPSTSAVLMSPAASYLPPAPSLFHTTSLPPAAPPPYEPEPMDRLLEEVIMGLDILPNNNSGGLNSLPLSSAGSSCTYASSGNVLTENKCVGSPPVLLEAESSRVVGGGLGRGGGVSSSAVPVLQQQGEGELNDMLENFLQSFEQHVGRWDEMERGSQSSTVVVLSEYRKTQTQTKAPHLKNTPRPLRCSQISELQQSDEAETLQSCPQLSPLAPLKHAEETVTRVGESRKNKKNQYPFSQMKGRKRKPVSSSKAREKTVHYRDKQLQQMPVVKLERSGPLPVRVTQQGRSCQSLEAESPGQTKSTPSSVKYPHGSWSMRSYPIRSRFREAHIMDSMPFLYEPLSNKKNHQITSNQVPREESPRRMDSAVYLKGVAQCHQFSSSNQ